jgi:hypothetical protein
MEQIKVNKTFLHPVKIKLIETGTTKKSKYKFRTTVMVWDEKLQKKWSIISRNGARYHRAKTLEVFEKAINGNNGIPILYNHIMDEKDMELLGLGTKVIDTDDGLVIEGYLNGNMDRVEKEIVPGFLNNVSLQVDAQREEVEEEGDQVTWASPTDLFEVSFVPVNGVPGANMTDIMLAEAVKKAKLKEAKEDQNIRDADMTEESEDEEIVLEESVNDDEETMEEYDMEESLYKEIFLKESIIKFNGYEFDSKKVDETSMKLYHRKYKDLTPESRIVLLNKMSKESVSINNEVSDKGDVEEDEIELSEDATTSNSGGAVGVSLRGRDEEKESVEDDEDKLVEMAKEILAESSQKYITVNFNKNKLVDRPLEIVYEDEKELKRLLKIYKKGLKVSHKGQGMITVKSVDY